MVCRHLLHYCLAFIRQRLPTTPLMALFGLLEAPRQILAYSSSAPPVQISPIPLLYTLWYSSRDTQPHSQLYPSSRLLPSTIVLCKESCNNQSSIGWSHTHSMGALSSMGALNFPLICYAEFPISPSNFPTRPGHFSRSCGNVLAVSGQNVTKTLVH